MARVPYLEAEDLAPEHRDLLKRPINFYKAMVNSPRARRAASHIDSADRAFFAQHHGASGGPARLGQVAHAQAFHVGETARILAASIRSGGKQLGEIGSASCRERV